MRTEKKARKLKELFVQGLVRIQGGTQARLVDDKCSEITTLACGAEGPKCSVC
jgi:hypothetical protein